MPRPYDGHVSIRTGPWTKTWMWPRLMLWSIFWWETMVLGIHMAFTMHHLPKHCCKPSTPIMATAEFREMTWPDRRMCWLNESDPWGLIKRRCHRPLRSLAPKVMSDNAKSYVPGGPESGQETPSACDCRAVLTHMNTNKHFIHWWAQ